MSVETRPMYWSLRRELFENRSVVLAPLIVSAVLLFAFLMTMTTMARRTRAVLALDAVQQRAAMSQPYDVAAVLLMMTGFVVGAFYCIDALTGERRDRSILFWKSLPVSDRTTVFSKAAIPLAVLPLYTTALILALQLVMFVLQAAFSAANHFSIATLWGDVQLFRQLPVLFYALAVMTLWHAPIYGWLLLVSARFRHGAMLWAVLPAVVISVVERVSIGTSHIQAMLRDRVGGGFHHAMDFPPIVKGHIPQVEVSHLTPLRFLSTPGLWIGLALAALFVTAAIRLRRSRQPL